MKYMVSRTSPTQGEATMICKTPRQAPCNALMSLKGRGGNKWLPLVSCFSVMVRI